MPVIADQVAALELDHADALAKIDALNATNAALTYALNAITAEKVALEARVAELSARNDGTIAMAQKVASSALDMLNAARLPAGTPAEVIPFAPKPKTAPTLPSDGLAEVLEEMLKPEPARQAVVVAGASDPVTLPMPSRPSESAAAVPIIEPISTVDRIKRHFLPGVTLMRRPVDRALPVDPGGLPMFLRRDTVFGRSAA